MRTQYTNTLFRLFFILSLFMGSLLFSAQIDNLVIEKIEIIGIVPEGTKFDANIVKSHIKIREGDFFSQTTFDSDLKTLACEYDRVEPSFEVINKKLQVTLKVWPKPLIRTISWNGNCSIATEDLQKELGICICTIFDRMAFNKAFHKLKAYYIKKGFFEAELSYTIQTDPCTNEVDIQVCINEGRSGWISMIFFEGFCPEEEEDILCMMVTKKFNIFTSWLTNEGLYNEEMIQYDQTQIINYLQNCGYADAVVKIEVRDSPRFFERIHLYIIAERGEKYNLGKVCFEGNELFCNEDIEKCILIEEGDCYCPELIQETASRIERLYGRKGYIDCVVSYEPKLELECGNVYSIQYFIEEGEVYNVGLIKIFGNCTTQTNVILHETLLVPGDVFNIDRLKKTEERLKNIGYFSNVNVYAVRTEEKCLPGNYRDVHIEVEEQQTGKFSAFVGASSTEGAFTGISITEKNFNSAGLPYMFSSYGPGLRGGGEFLSGSIQVGQKSRTYSGSWTKPYFMDTKWSVGFDIEKSCNRYISNDYDINSLGFTLRGNYEINPFLRAGIHYRITHSSVSLDHKAREYFECNELYKASRIHGLISAVGASLNYDSTDRFELPTRGYRSALEAEYAGVGGDHEFFSTAYLNSYYLSVRPFFPNDWDWCSTWFKGVLRFRFDLRFIQPLGSTHFENLPLDERLFLGGNNIIRGYKEYKLGAHFCEEEQGHSGDPKGGLSMQIFSIEYNHTFHQKVNGFLFIDAGQISTRAWHFGSLYASTGFGARIKVLDSFPPITMGIGFPINAPNKKYVKNFFFSFGGSF